MIALIDSFGSPVWDTIGGVVSCVIKKYPNWTWASLFFRRLSCRNWAKAMLKLINAVKVFENMESGFDGVCECVGLLTTIQL